MQNHNTLTPALSNSAAVHPTSGRAFWIDSKANYFQTDHALIDVAARHITAYGVAVFTCIERHAKFQTGEACPTIELIMAELGISEPTACKYVALLESCGMIEKRQTNWGNREQGPKSRNFYRVLPASKWSFLGLEKQVKAAPKSVKVAPKQIKSYKKNPNKKNVVQETSTGARAENVAASSISSNVSALTEKLVAVGVNPAAAAKLARQNEEAARRALDALQNAKGVESAAAWVVAAIQRGGYESAPQTRKTPAIANGGAYAPYVEGPPAEVPDKATLRARATAHIEACLALMEWARRDGYEKGMDGMDLKSRVDYLQRSAPREWSEAAHCIKRATAKTPDLPPATGKSNERVF